MYPILEKRLLAEGIWLMKVLAPRVARSAQPGQFVIVRVDEHGERIPLTISDFDAAEGSVTIVTQAIGASTRKICALNEGDALADFAGPLGHPSEFVKMPVEELRKRRYLFVAGGVGTAPVYPQVKWLHEHGALTDVIIGAKTARMLIYTEAMRSVATNLLIATDDGSLGHHGFVDALARQVSMSVSSLHRHFKSLTGFSPLQYHKQLRLYEAQRLMLMENERAANAALSVGYESVTQFNREYKRMFGEPPHRDINRRRKFSVTASMTVGNASRSAPDR